MADPKVQAESQLRRIDECTGMMVAQFAAAVSEGACAPPYGYRPVLRKTVR